MRKRKVKKEKVSRDSDRSDSWRSWFKLPKDSARDLLPCCGRLSPRQMNETEKTTAISTPVDAVVVPEAPAMTILPLPLSRERRSPAVARTFIAPDIVIAEEETTGLSSVNFEGRRTDESLPVSHSELRFLDVVHNGCLTPVNSIPSPALSKKSSANQLFPFACPGDYASALIRKFSVSSTDRKKGLEGSQRAKVRILFLTLDKSNFFFVFVSVSPIDWLIYQPNALSIVRPSGDWLIDWLIELITA